MTVILILGQMGMATSDGFGEGTLEVHGVNTGVYYDSDANPKLNITTLETIAPDEEITIFPDDITGYATFYNQTMYPTRDFLYYDTGASEPVLYDNLGKTYAGSSPTVMGVSVDSSFAFIAILVGVSAFVGIIGFQLFGSGESETSIFIIVILSGLIALWSVLSYGALGMITSIPIFGAPLYVIFTLMYCVGCFQAISNSGSSE